MSWDIHGFYIVTYETSVLANHNKENHRITHIQNVHGNEKQGDQRQGLDSKVVEDLKHIDTILDMENNLNKFRKNYFKRFLKWEVKIGSN